MRCMATFKFDRRKLMKSIAEGAEKAYRKAVAGVKCPDHGNVPTVKFSGTSATEMRWRFDNICCEKLQKAVGDAIEAAGLGKRSK